MPSTSLRASRLTTVAAASGATNWLNRATWRLFDAQGNLSPLVTATRSGTATFFDSTGTLQNAAANTPRVSYDPANLSLGPFLLAEEARTNSIRNSTMQGAVAGTPGTLPTNWTSSATAVGLTQQIIGTGTENGINYIDFRFTGTATGNNFVLSAEAAGQISASNGQNWACSWYVKVIAAPLPFTSYINRIRLNDANTAGAGQIDVSFTPTPTLARYSNSGAISVATTAFVQPQIRFGMTVGAAYDVTVRIGLPQLEQAATASSPILTYGTAVTRSADNLSVTNLGATGFNATEGTLYAHWLSDMPAGTGLGFVATLSDNAASSASRQLGIQARSLNSQIRVWQSSVGVGPSGSLDDPIIPISTAWSGKAASRWGGGQNVSAAANGSAIVTMVNPIESTAFNTLILGAAAGGFPLQGRIYQAAIIPQRVPDSGLQRLTRV